MLEFFLSAICCIYKYRGRHLIYLLVSCRERQRVSSILTNIRFCTEFNAVVRSIDTGAPRWRTEFTHVTETACAWMDVVQKMLKSCGGFSSERLRSLTHSPDSSRATTPGAHACRRSVRYRLPCFPQDLPSCRTWQQDQERRPPLHCTAARWLFAVSLSGLGAKSTRKMAEYQWRREIAISGGLKQTAWVSSSTALAVIV